VGAAVPPLPVGVGAEVIAVTIRDGANVTIVAGVVGAVVEDPPLAKGVGAAVMTTPPDEGAVVISLPPLDGVAVIPPPPPDDGVVVTGIVGVGGGVNTGGLVTTGAKTFRSIAGSK